MIHTRMPRHGFLLMRMRINEMAQRKQSKCMCSTCIYVYCILCKTLNAHLYVHYMQYFSWLRADSHNFGMRGSVPLKWSQKRKNEIITKKWKQEFSLNSASSYFFRFRMQYQSKVFLAVLFRFQLVLFRFTDTSFSFQMLVHSSIFR